MTPETKGERRESPKRLGAPSLADSASIPGWEIVQVVSASGLARSRAGIRIPATRSGSS
jgi:hypothetical protein